MGAWGSVMAPESYTIRAAPGRVAAAWAQIAVEARREMCQPTGSRVAASAARGTWEFVP
jgi:hypothetical protein